MCRHVDVVVMEEGKMLCDKAHHTCDSICTLLSVTSASTQLGGGPCLLQYAQNYDSIVSTTSSAENDGTDHVVVSSLVSEGVLAFLRCRNIDIYGIHNNVNFLRHL